VSQGRFQAAIDEDLAGFTIDNWIATHPDFAQAVHAVQWGGVR
jgi:hypothetical protein